MTLAALGEAALRTLLLAAAVQLGLWLFRVKQPRLLVAAWTVVLAASLAMPVLQRVTPLRLPIVDGLPGTSPTKLAPSALSRPAPQASVPPPAAGTAGAMAEPLLEAVYALVSGGLVLRLVVGIALALRLLGRAAPVREDWTGGADIRISRDVAAPVTIARVILLPADAASWSPAMRRAVLAHERAHVAHWDFAMLLASQANRAMFWFSPLSWWLHRRLAVLAELVSDDAAMQVTGDRHDYAAILLEMGRRSGPPLLELPMARVETLPQRIERILLGEVKPDPARPAQQVMLTLVAAGLAVAAASSRSVPGPSSASTGLVEAQLSAAPDAEPPSAVMAVGSAAEPMPAKLPHAAAAAQAPPHPGHELRPPTPATGPRVPATAWMTARQIPGLENRGMRAAMASPRSVVDGLRTASPQPSGGRDRTEDDGGEVSGAGRAPSSGRDGRSAADVPPTSGRVDEPVCTGAYASGSGSPPEHNGIELLQTRFFRQSDGSPWLRILLGEKALTRLHNDPLGTQVEESRIRTTVFAKLPRHASALAGTAQSPFGNIDFSCRGIDARL